MACVLASGSTISRTLILGEKACKNVGLNTFRYFSNFKGNAVPWNQYLPTRKATSVDLGRTSIIMERYQTNRMYTVVTGKKAAPASLPQSSQTPDDKGDKAECKGDIDVVVKETLEQFKDGKYEKVTDPTDLQHFRSTTKTDYAKGPPVGEVVLPHPIWSEEEVHSVQVTHKEPEKFVDRVALASVKLLRKGFDLMSGYNRKPRDEGVWLNRICFLETVAGVPGMVAAMTRHLHSLRRMRRDHGWIHTLLEEAENERMHLMTALNLKKPSWFFRQSVVVTQGVFVTFFSIAYLISPRYCHRFVGYLEEEAVVTYTKCLRDIDEGLMKHWKTQQAPDVAIRYWKLAPESTMRDVILAIRADEAHHRVVNHTLGSLNKDDFNPYGPGK